MKLCTFVADNGERIGAVVEDEKKVVDLNAGYAFYLKAVDDDDKAVDIANVRVPPDMIKLLEGGKSSLKAVHTTVDYVNKLKEPDPRDPAGRKIIYGLNEIKLSAPIPRPPAIFDGRGTSGVFKEVAAVGVKISSEDPIEPSYLPILPSCVIGPGDPIVFPRNIEVIFSSIELGLVVGKRAWRVPLEEAEEYIAGYIIASDVTRFGLPGISGVRKEPLQFTSFPNKSAPTAKPMGPWLVLREQIKDPLNLNYKVLINDEIKQQANLNEYKNSPHLRSAPWYISSASQYFPLEIGSVILYGATEGTTKAVPKPGDTMRFELEGVGTLENPVIAET